MATLSGPLKVMTEGVPYLATTTAQTSDDRRKIEILEQITDYCVDLEMARGFHRIGGFSILPRLLVHENPEIRWRTAELIAVLVQNNHYCQNAALQVDLMKPLLGRLSSDKSDKVRIKALYAVSSMVRGSAEAKESLINHGGVTVLVKDMQANNVNLQTKAAFLMAYLAHSSEKLKKMLTSKGAVPELVQLLRQPHAGYHEYLMSALCNLTEDNKTAISACRQPELGLKQLLEERVLYLAGNEQFMEEEEHCRNLLLICFDAKVTPKKSYALVGAATAAAAVLLLVALVVAKRNS